MSLLSRVLRRCHGWDDAPAVGGRVVDLSTLRAFIAVPSTHDVYLAVQRGATRVGGVLSGRERRPGWSRSWRRRSEGRPATGESLRGAKRRVKEADVTCMTDTSVRNVAAAKLYAIINKTNDLTIATRFARRSAIASRGWRTRVTTRKVFITPPRRNTMMMMTMMMTLT